MSRLHRTALAVLTAATIVACGRAAQTRPPVTPAAETSTPATSRARTVTLPPGAPVTIAVSAQFDGDEKTLGADIADSAQLALDDYGPLVGRPVKLVRKDDGCSDPEKAAAAARGLVAEGGISGVIGPMCATGVQAAGSIYADAGIAHLTATATRADLSAAGDAYFFRVAWSDETQAKTQATYAHDPLGAGAAVIIDDGQPYGKGLGEAFETEFTSRGGRIAARDRVPPGTTDFSALSKRVAGADAGVIVFEGLNPDAALLVKKLRADGFRGTFMAPDAALSERDFLEPAKEFAEGAVISAGPTPDEAFVRHFRGRFGRAPATRFALQAHDATTALLRAIEVSATSRGDGSIVLDRDGITAVLRAQRFDGYTGPVSFDERGERRGDSPAAAGLMLYRVVAGKFDPIR